ncbi:MAG: ACT domain-containing protein [Anaerolineales bacterium]
MERIRIGGVIVHHNLARIQASGIQGVDLATGLLSAFANNKINIQFIVHLFDDSYREQLILAVDKADVQSAFYQVCKLQKATMINHFSIQLDCALVGIHGPDFRIRPGIAGLYVQTLRNHGIRIMAISTSISTCAVLLSAKQVETAFHAIGLVFDYSKVR